MRYSTFNLSSPHHDGIQSLIRECQFGILHIRCSDTDSKLAILVKLKYSERLGLTCRVVNAEDEKIITACNEPVSLKVCSKEKNIYLVANVTVVGDQPHHHLWSKDGFKMIIKKFIFFRKNKFQQMVPQKAA